MARAQSVGLRRWRWAPDAAAPRAPVRLPAAASLGAISFLFLVAAATRGTPAFRVLLSEDTVFEWLQAACLAGAAGLAVRGAVRAGPGRYRVVLAGVGFATLAVVGEELAWGTRLLDLSLEPVQAVNHQGDVTLHNVGMGLNASFLGMAAVSTVLAGWRAARRDLDLACWFAVPAVYGAVRLLAGAATYEAAKMSEVAELVFAIAVLRLLWAFTRPVRPAA